MSQQDKLLVGDENAKGIMLKQYATLRPYKGWIRQCTLTLLKPSQWADSIHMIHPADAHEWKLSKEELANEAQQVTCFRPRLPAPDVQQMTRTPSAFSLEPHGIVEIKALRGATQQKVDNWQQHFFGNYPITDDIPKMFAYLRRYSAKGVKDIAQEIRSSCVEFVLWRDKYLSAIHRDQIQLAEAGMAFGRQAEDRYTHFYRTELYDLLLNQLTTGD